MISTLTKFAFACVIAIAPFATHAHDYVEADSEYLGETQECNELDLAHRWNIMLVRDHFTSVVDIFDRQKVPVPQVYLWEVKLFPHPTYKGASTEAYEAMKPLAKQFYAGLTDTEKSCPIVFDNGSVKTNFGELGPLLVGLSGKD